MQLHPPVTFSPKIDFEKLLVHEFGAGLCSIGAHIASESVLYQRSVVGTSVGSLWTSILSPQAGRSWRWVSPSWKSSIPPSGPI